MKEELKINRAKERAKGFLRQGIEVARLILALPLACGYINFKGTEQVYHDHGTQPEVVITAFASGRKREPYDKEKHGEVYDYVAEGERVPGFLNTRDGELPIHRHDGRSLIGSQEFNYE